MAGRSPRVLPMAPPLFTQLRYLILPAIPLVLILFGYIARMARTGTIEALDSDYVRTATLKGLPRRVVIRRHVLPQFTAAVPSRSVATQTGYLIGVFSWSENLFVYPGIGRVDPDCGQPTRTSRCSKRESS